MMDRFTNKINLLIGILLISDCICSLKLSAQGCSDAGICTAGGMHGGAKDEGKGSVVLSYLYGVGEQDVKISTPQIEGNLRIGSKGFIQLKVPYVFASGNIGKNSGLGDIIAILNYRFYDKHESKMSLNIGSRVGVNNANNHGDISSGSGIGTLPMPYQTGLGTLDFLIGADLKYKDNWLFAVGFQTPLTQYNQNEFDTSLIVPGSMSSESYGYFSSYHLYRAPDLVLRADRVFNLNDKLSITGGLLAIYHLRQDKTTSTSGIESAVHGSKGLTLNLPLAFNYQFNSSLSLAVRYATPLIVREVRPDGLTRKYVLGMEVRYHF